MEWKSNVGCNNEYDAALSEPERQRRLRLLPSLALRF
jgi:hypothetical protein